MGHPPPPGTPPAACRGSMSRILIFNAGSSSLRSALYRVDAGAADCLWQDHREQPPEQLGQQLDDLLATIPLPVDAAAHRVVHGGPQLWRPARISEQVERAIEQAGELAPLHNPHALNLLRRVRAQLDPELAHIACFDTGFYHDLPEVAATYPLPHGISSEQGLRRYGFHGLAHQSMLAGLSACHSAASTPRRVISLQLGGGCSVTASLDDRALDTSMGFTPLEGLMMRTRCGDIDPGLLFHLKRSLGLSDAGLESLLNHDSGLLGVSGRSGDMKTLLEADDDRSRLAVELFCYRTRKYLAAYTGVLGGVDAVLFGGGVGENAAPVRAGILEGLDYLGIRLDPDLNSAARGERRRISSDDSRVEVWVMPVDEGALMARQAAELLTRET
ncbi:MAG: acetate kinase [Gammaproteobacteria bacterium]|nr:acetate kinase [Gammaproteobacteria bacterium]